MELLGRFEPPTSCLYQGRIAEHEKRDTPISLEKIETAVINLYGGWDTFPQDSKTFIQDAFNNGNFENIYKTVKEDEVESKDMLIGFDEKYPQVTNKSNVDDILNMLIEKKKTSSNGNF